MVFPSRSIDKFALSKECWSPHTCEHSRSEIRNLPDVNGRPAFWHQCLECGGKVGRRVKSSEITDAGRIPPFDKELQDRSWRRHQEDLTKLAEVEQRKLDMKWKLTYDLYLRSDEWMERRRRVIDRAKGICEGCRDAAAAEVHHLTYSNVGEEFLFELVALCRACHARYHGRNASFPTAKSP